MKEYWKDQFNFSEIDKNQDSELSRPEFHDMMNRRRLRNSGREKTGEKAFTALDVNKDGLVTVEEMAKGTDISKDKVMERFQIINYKFPFLRSC